MRQNAGVIASVLAEQGKAASREAKPWNRLLAHRDVILLSLIFIAGFLLKFLPIMQYARVGGDPFLHYRYALALLEGKTSVAITVSDGSTIELHYPPLFHLLCLGFFLAFPTIDPYAIMKVLAVTFDSMQVIPLYFMVKRVSHSGISALFASYFLLSVRSDYQMLSWGGYANIAGLLLICVLFYFVMTDRPILSAIVTLALALTHHLSFLFAALVLAGYFVLVLFRGRSVAKTLLGVAAGGAVAYIIFYRFAISSILDFYSKFSPTYNQSLYVAPYILEQVGLVLVVSAVLGFGVSYARFGWKFDDAWKILLTWAVVPVTLAFAYLFGVQWHGVRWIHFIPLPLLVWTGIGTGHVHHRRIVFPALFVIFTIQLILTLQGYQSDILSYLVQP